MTPPCDLTIGQSENCAPADHSPCDPLPHLPLKKPLDFVPGVEDILGVQPPSPCMAFLCSKLDIWVCLSGTQTRTNTLTKDGGVFAPQTAQPHARAESERRWPGWAAGPCRDHPSAKLMKVGLLWRPLDLQDSHLPCLMPMPA